jgi:thiol-disulfide isomerase/thioredoxin
MSFKSFLAAAAVIFAANVSASEVGQPAPQFALPGASGQVSLSALKGKVVYVDFWASWCGPCKQSFPWMNDMQAKYGAQGLTIVGINVDKKRADADAFLANTPAKFTVAYDEQGTTPTAYKVKGMPSSYLVGRDGKVIATHTGFRPEEAAALEAKLRAALGLK